MTLTERLRTRAEIAGSVARHRTRADVLFVTVVCLLLAVHATIFFATLVVAPVTVAEARGDALLHLPVEVARALLLPFHALLLGCLFVLGRRVAGRWAGFGAMLALLALNLRADPALPVYGPPTAGGGWVAAAMLAAAAVVLGQRRLLAAVLVGVAVAGDGLMVLALPAFLIAIAIQPAPSRAGKARGLLAFAGMWLAVAVAGQVLWIGSLGVDGWLSRLAVYAREFQPHALVPFLEQQRLVFAAWHFPPLVTITLAVWLFVAAGIGVVRYFVVPRPEEQGPGACVVLRRLPPELWAIGLTMVGFATWWTFSGDTVMVDPNLPALAAGAPLLTPLAYRGAKWLLTVNRFWALCGTVYLVGLITARSTQLILTLIHSFQR